MAPDIDGENGIEGDGEEGDTEEEEEEEDGVGEEGEEGVEVEEGEDSVEIMEDGPEEEEEDDEEEEAVNENEGTFRITLKPIEYRSQINTIFFFKKLICILHFSYLFQTAKNLNRD